MNWLKSLPLVEKKAIGEDIKAVQFGWPLGLPLVDHIDGDIWEVRIRLANRIARVLFVVDAMKAAPAHGTGAVMALLHGFIKKAAVPARQRNKFVADLVAKAVARQEDELTRIAVAVSDEERRNPELAREMHDWEVTLGDGMEEPSANAKPQAR